ncbi:hypothetical protein O988_09477, partial [Pseudogymnoascus sp. VKM F-3808]
PPQDDPSLSPKPLVITPHTARANAKAQAARDKRVSIGAAPGGGLMRGEGRRTSISRGDAGRRVSVNRGGGGGGEGREKRDSIVVMRERCVPPKPLGSRGFIALASDASGGGHTGQGGYAAGASSAQSGYGYTPTSTGYAGYGTYGGVAGGVSTGRVVKAVDRMVESGGETGDEGGKWWGEAEE